MASGQVDQLELTDEHGAESLTRFRFAANDIGLVDRGYARYRDLRELMDVGAHPLMRMGWECARLAQARRQAIRDVRGVGQAEELEGEVRVAVQPGAKLAAAPPLILRLVMRRKTSQEAEEAQKRLRKEAGKRGKKPDPRSLEAAKYILILTSLPRRLFPTRDVLSLYRLRWQFELAFKRFKSLAGLSRLPAKNPDLARAWIYARLIAALMAERLAGNVPTLPLWIPQGRRYASRGGDASRFPSQASSPPSAVRSLGALSSKPSGVCGACCVNLRAADQHNRSIYEHAYVSAYAPYTPLSWNRVVGSWKAPPVQLLFSTERSFTMGVDLMGNGGYSLNWYAWERMLDLAEAFGWSPAGTIEMDPDPCLLN